MWTDEVFVCLGHLLDNSGTSHLFFFLYFFVLLFLVVTARAHGVVSDPTTHKPRAPALLVPDGGLRTLREPGGLSAECVGSA